MISGMAAPLNIHCLQHVPFEGPASIGATEPQELCMLPNIRGLKQSKLDHFARFWPDLDEMWNFVKVPVRAGRKQLSGFQCF